MQIGAVSRQLNIPASAIRYYERIGLIKQQLRISGRRHFDIESLRVLRFIKLAQTAQFSIQEIKSLLSDYDADPGSKGVWKPFAESKRVALRKQIEELGEADRILAAMLKCECQNLSQCVSKAAEQGVNV
jgi:MerR family redox-sensitive transcriptional activator SoxR